MSYNDNVRQANNTLLRLCAPIWGKLGNLEIAYYSDCWIDAERIVCTADKPLFVAVGNCGTYCDTAEDRLNSVVRYGWKEYARYKVRWDSRLERLDYELISEYSEPEPITAL